MSGPMNRMAIDVAELRKGMYVAEPDRPWIELPFPLQGFIIETDEELAILREYCDYVFVDPERCHDSENERDLVADHGFSMRRQTARRPRAARIDRDDHDDGIDESRRQVDTDKLQPQVEAAGRVLASARRFVDEAFTSAYRGDGVDLPAARSTLTELIVRLTRNPTAILLLTSLNDQDNFTSTHSVHSCVLMLAFCMRAKVEERKLEVLGLGALLHDIGKAHLPPEWMNRPGPLTEDEWEVVKQHPIQGLRILADSGDVPTPALNITSMHHERRDGKGYPYGLTRAYIPEYVQATALVNRYQSLTTPRPYREASAPDQVLRSFYREADSLYGTRPVEAFIRCVGIYPAGCVVELDNGALAVVVSSRPNSRLRPCVQLVRTPDGEPYDKLVLINLAAEAEKWEKRDLHSVVRQVRRVRSPADTGIDPGAVIAESFGVELA